MLPGASTNREVGARPEQPVERRMAMRYPVNADTTCPMVMPVKDDLGPARVRDVSTDGVGLLLSRPVEPGSYIVVTLKNQAQNFSRIQLVQVVHATKAAGGYSIGGTFLTLLTHAELSKLLL